ncbi:MAG: LEA type 2 family protein [Candidatus Poribacteria bacterium]|nr:LEA type 2 family protein [Candidatus Poribacteria bacterium]
MMKKMDNKTSPRVHAGLVVCLVLLSGCAMFEGLLGGVKVELPQVEFTGAKIDSLSFDGVGFLFDLQIRNPNALGIKLAGFDYDFLIDGTSFLTGNQEKGLEIPARGASTVQIPLSLRYVNLYKTFQSLRDQDESTYQINAGFSFNLPVLGDVRVPVSKAGNFPVLKLPTVNLDALKLTSLGLSGAKLKLGIRLKNPNAFLMILDRFQYQFNINGKRWIAGEATESTQVAEKGESLIEIPISLDFFKIGTSVYQLLKGDQSLNYQFQGSLDLKTSLPLLGQVTLPFDRLGQVELRR